MWRLRSRLAQRTVSTDVSLSYRKQRAWLDQECLENRKIKKIYFLTPGLLETEYVDPGPTSGLYHSAHPPEQTRDLQRILVFYINGKIGNTELTLH